MPNVSQARVTCDKCGKEYGIGHFPYCPHGKYYQKSGELPLMYDEHAEVWYKTPKEHLQRGLAKGLEPRATRRGLPRSEY